jgi:hypothetical protein
MRAAHIALAVAFSSAACSLIVQFDPDGQPCGPNSECLAGYACSSGRCHRLATDGGDLCAGVTCTTPGPCQEGNGVCDPPTGTCVYAAKPLGRTCDDQDLCTQGEKCDGDGGCAPATRTRCDTPSQRCQTDAGVCDATTGTCTYDLLPSGASCEDGDPCTVGETCGAGNFCSGGSARICNTPPNTCTQLTGTCDSIRGCVYAPRAGATCDDNNTCTQGDACDAGTCVPGPSCPPPAACLAGTCQANGTCSYAPAADGVSCGANQSQRCCGGACVDISSSAAHCGGCNIACKSGFACESVAVQTLCSPFNPPNTSGRCTCDSTMVASCPNTQTCRAASPGLNRCTPPDAAACAPGEKVQAIAGCPSYCFY